VQLVIKIYLQFQCMTISVVGANAEKPRPTHLCIMHYFIKHFQLSDVIWEQNVLFLSERGRARSLVCCRDEVIKSKTNYRRKRNE
jgi:hypothetical protein